MHADHVKINNTTSPFFTYNVEDTCGCNIVYLLTFINVCQDNILRFHNEDLFAELNVCVPCTKCQLSGVFWIMICEDSSLRFFS